MLRRSSVGPLLVGALLLLSVTGTATAQVELERLATPLPIRDLTTAIVGKAVQAYLSDRDAAHSEKVEQLKRRLSLEVADLTFQANADPAAGGTLTWRVRAKGDADAARQLEPEVIGLLKNVLGQYTAGGRIKGHLLRDEDFKRLQIRVDVLPGEKPEAPGRLVQLEREVVELRTRIVALESRVNSGPASSLIAPFSGGNPPIYGCDDCCWPAYGGWDGRCWPAYGDCFSWSPCFPSCFPIVPTPAPIVPTPAPIVPTPAPPAGWKVTMPPVENFAPPLARRPDPYEISAQPRSEARKEAPKLDPIDLSGKTAQDAPALYWQGYRLYWTGEYASALAHFKAAVSLDDSDARFWCYKGIAELALEDRTAADASWERAAERLQQNPSEAQPVARALERLQGEERRLISNVLHGGKRP